MPQDLTAIKREKINRDASSGLITTNGMGERKVNGKESYSKTPVGNQVLESTSGSKHDQAKAGK